MSLADMAPDDRARALVELTTRLTERLIAEADALEAYRPGDVAASVKETQRLADLYRAQAAVVRRDPGLLAGASMALRRQMIDTTRRFHVALQRHSAAAEASRRISDGLIRTIAAVVTERRRPAAGYGPSAHAAPGDARAIAVNRRA